MGITFAVSVGYNYRIFLFFRKKQLDHWESASTRSLESSHTASANMSEQHCQINTTNIKIHVDETIQARLGNTYNNQQSNTLQSTNPTKRDDSLKLVHLRYT